MKILLGSLITIAFLIAAAVLFSLSGCYDVSAVSRHADMTVWFLEVVRDRSIAYHSKGIHPPPLEDPKLVGLGFREYCAMCQMCHGAPGLSATEISQGLNPKPPNLASRDIQKRKDAELFWIVKNGIKMTGMPAFGPTHKEDELWTLIAFLRRLPNLKPGEYEIMAKKAGLTKKEDHHHPGSKK